MITKDKVELRKAVGQVLTMQYDYPFNGMGSVGYKGDNIYRFNVDDIGEIQLAIMERAESGKHSYNVEMLAQEMITDLLDAGLIRYDGEAYKSKVVSI
jgi:ubiquitin-protein ligase